MTLSSDITNVILIVFACRLHYSLPFVKIGPALDHCNDLRNLKPIILSKEEQVNNDICKKYSLQLSKRL